MSIQWRTQDPPGERIIVSYVTLRRLIGGLGMALPFLVMLETWIQGGRPWALDSISAAYDFQSRDLFVGTLFTLAWFFFAYRGLETQDDIAGNVAGACALGVALVPYDASECLGRVHLVFATALFLTLAYFSMALFTKTGGAKSAMTANKVKRNRVYRTCGWFILGSIAALAIYKFTSAHWTLGPVPAFFAFETVALEAFGISWMVKGETVWTDQR